VNIAVNAAAVLFDLKLIGLILLLYNAKLLIFVNVMVFPVMGFIPCTVHPIQL
jgi:hypothetical protein